MAWNDFLFKKPDAASESTDPLPPPAPSLLATRLAAATAARTPAPTFVASAPTSVAQPDPEFTAEILAALERFKLPGFRELSAQMTLLEPAIPDETQRLNVAATSTAAFMKIDRSQITAAVREQVDLIDAARAAFEGGLRTEADQRTTTYTNHLRDVEAKIAAVKAELTTLESDRTTTATQLAQIQVETATVTTRYMSAWTPLHDLLVSTLNRLGGSR
jgi:hypothetical protein